MSNPSLATTTSLKRARLSTLAFVTTLAFGAGALTACEELDATRKKTENQSKTYQQQVARIEIDLDAGDITVVKGDAGEVSVERDLRWKHTKPTTREKWDGDTLRVSAVCPDDNGCSVDYSIRVPQGVVVQADTEAGNLSIRDIAGDLDLASKAGDVTVENATGRVRIKGDSGKITGRDLRSSTVDAETKAGMISLSFATVPRSAKAITEDGGVEIAVPRDDKDGYRVQATTNDGKRRVSIDVDADGRNVIVARVESGDVTVRYA